MLLVMHSPSIADNFSNITIKFLPRNTTTKKQPLTLASFKLEGQVQGKASAICLLYGGHREECAPAKMSSPLACLWQSNLEEF